MARAEVIFQFAKPLEGDLGFLAFWVRAGIFSFYMSLFHMAFEAVRSGMGEIFLASRTFR